MAGKDKGGRETRKPKQDHNKKVSGQTPATSSPALDTIKQGARPKH
jgi:hypothetical protein